MQDSMERSNSKMKSSLVLTMTLALAMHQGLAFGESIASCKDPEGKAYFSFLGNIKKSSTGWDNDKITGGITSLQLTDGELDITFTDNRKQIFSTKSEGGSVSLVRIGPNNFSVLVYYENNTIEVYTFIKENDGQQIMHQLQSKGGLGLIHKSSVMISKCDYINFDRINWIVTGKEKIK